MCFHPVGAQTVSDERTHLFARRYVLFRVTQAIKASPHKLPPSVSDQAPVLKLLTWTTWGGKGGRCCARTNISKERQGKKETPVAVWEEYVQRQTSPDISVFVCTTYEPVASPGRWKIFLPPSWPESRFTPPHPLHDLKLYENIPSLSAFRKLQLRFGTFSSSPWMEPISVRIHILWSGSIHRLTRAVREIQRRWSLSTVSCWTAWVTNLIARAIQRLILLCRSLPHTHFLVEYACRISTIISIVTSLPKTSATSCDLQVGSVA